MTRRVGASVLELLVVVAILAVLTALVLTAVQQARAAASLTQSMNNLRQQILGVHQLADEDAGRIKDLHSKGTDRHPLLIEQTIFARLLPYTYGPRTQPDIHASSEAWWLYMTPPVAAYLDPADPTLSGASVYINVNNANVRGRCSYVANAQAFDKMVTLPTSVPDGTASTIALTTHYWLNGIPKDVAVPTAREMILNYDTIYPDRVQPDNTSPDSHRRASFADPGWGDVVPVTDPAGKATVASDRGLTFQHRPRPQLADHRLPQTNHRAGLPVALFDCSVRTIAPGVDESVFWALVTPNGGEVVGDF